MHPATTTGAGGASPGTLRRDQKNEAPGLPGRECFKGTGFDNPDSAENHAKRKRIADLTARAARLGLQVRVGASGCCLVTTEKGTEATFPSVQACEGLVYAAELAQAEIRSMVMDLARGRHA